MERIKQWVPIFMVMYVCCTNDQRQLKEVNLNNTLSMTIPKDWEIKEKQGIDSYAFEITNSRGLTLHGDLGRYSTQLLEPSFPVFDIKLKDSLLKRTSNQLNLNTVHFSENPEEDNDQRIFSKQFYIYDTINSIVVKLVQPKKIGDGMTGIYVPKLKDGNSLSIYAENVDSLEHMEILRIFKTIKFK